MDKDFHLKNHLVIIANIWLAAGVIVLFSDLLIGGLCIGLGALSYGSARWW